MEWEVLTEDNSKRFVFFIDGLDEFDGDCAELADFPLQKSARPKVKICVASRPWLVFEDDFRRQPSLRLEDLTSPDIKLFVSEKFRGSSMFIYLEKMRPEEARKLITEVMGKASGVFLWVRLVVLSLLEGLRDGDTIADLHNRLLLLPSDLEQLFFKILSSLNPTYFEQASRMFQYVRAAQGTLSLLCVSFAEDGFENAMLARIGPLSVEERDYRAETMRRRLTSRCKGLLEVPTHHREGSSARVQYLHRTVKDFLRDPKIWSHIRSATPDSFDPDLMLYGAFLLEIKSMTMPQGNISSFKELLKAFIYYSCKLETKAVEMHISSLDEMDRAANIPFQRQKGIHGKDPRTRPDRRYIDHWSALVADHGISPYSSFFDYAFKYPLYTYVDKRLSAGLLTTSQIDGKSLLSIAAESEDRQVMKILLKYGADPNLIPNYTRLPIWTPWQKVLGSIYDLHVNAEAIRKRPTTSTEDLDLQPANDPVNWKEWAEILQIFLEHNADPTLTVHHVPLGTFIEQVFGQWNRRQTNVLLDLWTASKREKDKYRQQPREYEGLSEKCPTSQDTAKKPSGITSFLKKFSHKKAMAM